MRRRGNHQPRGGERGGGARRGGRGERGHRGLVVAQGSRVRRGGTAAAPQRSRSSPAHGSLRTGASPQMLSRLLSKSIPNRGPHVRGEKREKEGFSGVPLRLGSPGGRRWRRRVWKAQGRGQEGDGLPPAPLPTGAASITPTPREGGREERSTRLRPARSHSPAVSTRGVEIAVL